MSDRVATFVQYRGAAASRSPIGADIDPQRFQFIERTGRTALRSLPEKAIYDSGGEISELSEWLTEAVGRISRRNIILQRQRVEFRTADSQDRGVQTLAAG